MKEQKQKNNSQPKEQISVTHQPKQAPVQEPDTRKNTPVVGNKKGAAGPYILAWLLGVPASLLIVMALLRAVF